MALGGGTFVSQNKKLPGSYINFVSVAHATAGLSDRGYVAMGMTMDWGEENKIIKITKEDAVKNLRKLVGHAYTEDSMADIRDIFQNATVLYTYKLNSECVKASCDFGEARYTGVLGNSLKIVIANNVDDDTKFDVKTYLDNGLEDTQTVANASELVANDYVVFNKSAELVETAGTSLTGGTNGTVSADRHSAFLDAVEPYSFNAIAYKGDEPKVKALYTTFTQRMRDEVGVKFQCVLYNYPQADYEGVISVANTDTVVPWLLGAEGGCAVNKSCTNKLYNGEADLTNYVGYTQADLEAFIDAGQLVLHKVNDDIRILTDINTLKSTTLDKGDVFKANQTMRVIDQIGNDIAILFNTKYIGAIPNNAAGRVSLWSDIVKHHKELQTIGAIEDFSDSNVVVMQGDTKRAVVVQDVVTVVNAMEQLYMTVTVQ